MDNINFIILKKVFKEIPRKYYIFVGFITAILIACLGSTLPFMLSPSKYSYLVNVTNIHNVAPVKWETTVNQTNGGCVIGTKLNIVDYNSLQSYNDQMLFVDLNCESGNAYVLQSNAKKDEESNYLFIFIAGLCISCPVYFVYLIFFIMDFLCKRKWYLEDLEEQQKKINNLKSQISNNNLEPHGTYKLSLVAVV